MVRGPHQPGSSTTTTLPPLPTDTDVAVRTESESPAQSAPSTGHQRTDQFEQAPGASFVNTLLGLDQNADGRIDRQEFAAGQDTLARLAGNGQEADTAEAALLQALQQHCEIADGTVVQYDIRDGQLHLTMPRANQTPPVMRVLDHQLNPPQAFPNTLRPNVPSASGSELAVRHGTDPGDFYCEHMFFGAQMEASQPDSTVLTNQSGEKLVGFLHIPSDSFTRQAGRTGYTQEDRHQGTRQVVGAALRGYYDEIQSQNPEGPVRILVTGYDTFHSVRNNPTGDFVAHRENLDASMQQAFGDRLLQPEGTLVSQREEPPSQVWRYEVHNPDTGTSQEVLLTTAVFPVADSAIDPSSSSSVQQLMRDSSAQAVLSMGVASWQEYRAEHHADSGGLQRTGGTQHNDAASDRVQLRDNYALARAIASGSQTP